MFAIGSLLVVVLISLLVTRVATIALTATGLSREMARFQARSAFTGTGFTTAEAEAVVRHPVRRRIVLALMLAGNAGLAAVVASLMLGFTRGGTGAAGYRVLELIVGLAGLVALARSRWVDRRLSPLIHGSYPATPICRYGTMRRCSSSSTDTACSSSPSSRRTGSPAALSPNSSYGRKGW